ncbi:MAG: ferrous iron transport protein B [Clostridia bacterium]|nr:ferrous iron transport protein B [Clostridia bacterium]
MKRFALAGNPNCGKTTLFNVLTGSTAHVGNWPGVTVDKKEGTYKKLAEPIEIVDLPGIYSLSPYTPEEIISRNYILDNKPDCVINIVDVTNLERNLYLTTQLMEIDVPVVIALNMMDELSKNGDSIDAKELQKRIGLPVVAISALREVGTDELMQIAYIESQKPRVGRTVIEHKELLHLIGDCRIALIGQGVENALFHAVKLAEMDELEVCAHPVSARVVQEFKKTFSDDIFGKDIDAIIADSRYKHITKNYSPILKRNKNFCLNHGTKSDKIDKVLTHKIWSIPIFLLIMFFVFHLTFAESLFFVNSFGVKTPIYSPGVFLFNLMESFTGFLSSGAQGLLNSWGAKSWLVGLVVDGILGGVFAVMSFLPQILLLFFFFSLLEDSGYMARVAFILDKMFRKFGLSGRAFLPMIMGFGCSVPAMVNTRTLADQNERTATIRVIPFFSCGAKLPILTAIAGAIMVMTGSGNADLITYGMYIVGIVVAILSVLIMRNTSMKGEIPPFIMELPTYRLPAFKNLMLHLWDKAKHFIEKAFTIILASTVVIWFVSHFSFNWQFLADEEINKSILAGLGALIQPLFTPLGFGSQLGEWGWVFAVAAITGLIAKENVIATFGTLGACVAGAIIDIETDGGVGAVMAMVNATNISVPALLAFILFNMTTIPCFATVATAKAELPTKKLFNNTLVFWIATSYVVASIVYLVGSWWWTAFIFGALAIVVAIVIVAKNKSQSQNKLKA